MFILIGFNGLNKIKLVFVLCVLTFVWEMFMRKESDYSLIEVNKRFISYLVIYIISITTVEILVLDLMDKIYCDPTDGTSDKSMVTNSSNQSNLSTETNSTNQSNQSNLTNSSNQSN